MNTKWLLVGVLRRLGGSLFWLGEYIVYLGVRVKNLERAQANIVFKETCSCPAHEALRLRYRRDWSEPPSILPPD